MNVVLENSMRLFFPMVRDPWDKKDYAVLLFARVRDARPGRSPSYLTVLGQNKDGEKKQFSVPMRDWQLAHSNPTPFVETEIPHDALVGADGKPLVPGSNIINPFRINLVVVRDPESGARVAVAYAEAMGAPAVFYRLTGSRDDGATVVFNVAASVFENARKTPKMFVQVESLSAPLVKNEGAL